VIPKLHLLELVHEGKNHGDRYEEQQATSRKPQ
jgi:hypothetical protein